MNKLEETKCKKKLVEAISSKRLVGSSIHEWYQIKKLTKILSEIGQLKRIIWEIRMIVDALVAASI